MGAHEQVALGRRPSFCRTDPDGPRAHRSLGGPPAERRWEWQPWWRGEPPPLGLPVDAAEDLEPDPLPPEPPSPPPNPELPPDPEPPDPQPPEAGAEEMESVVVEDGAEVDLEVPAPWRFPMPEALPLPARWAAAAAPVGAAADAPAAAGARAEEARPPRQYGPWRSQRQWERSPMP